MSADILEIPHTSCVSQLARHLSSVPPRQVPFSKRGSIAIVLRLHTSNTFPPYTPKSTSNEGQLQSLHEFLSHPNFTHARAQILYMQRSAHPGDPWSGHIGFPGGKREETDTDDKMTAIRETREELGLELEDADRFVYLGELDTCNAYMWFNLQTLMVVTPHVFLQVVKETPDLQLSGEVASAHWVDLEQLLVRVQNPCTAFSKTYRSIPLDMAARLFPRQAKTKPFWFRAVQKLVGTVHYTVLPLGFERQFSVVRANNHGEVNARYQGVRFASESELFLWGISLEITSNLVDMMLPVDPTDIGGYVSVASPWPQFQAAVWKDVNWVANAVHAYMWGPHRRRPYTVGGLNFFRAHVYVLRATVVPSMVAKIWLVYLAVRAAHRLISK